MRYRSDKDNKTIKMVVITWISEKEEAMLDEGETVILERGEMTFKIDPVLNLYCYGEMNFSTGSRDYRRINGYNWMKETVTIINTHYDYENHCCYSESKYPMWIDSTNISKIVQFKHGCLGKPKRCVIFKYNPK